MGSNKTHWYTKLSAFTEYTKKIEQGILFYASILSLLLKPWYSHIKVLRLGINQCNGLNTLTNYSNKQGDSIANIKCEFLCVGNFCE